MSEIDAALDKISALVATFQRNESRYKSTKYSEAEARKDFIDKFWIALGWDVNHDQQTNPYEQEVKVERGVATGESQRRADYAFYFAPKFHDVRFFVEAKKPAAELETKENYFQVIRYGWNSKTPLAVLTDFEELHVLDCRYKPDIETALHRAIAKHHYTDYANRDKFLEIYWLFSREAVASGSLEKRAKELPKPRGKAVQRGLFPGEYQSIDESFLAELDQHREALARNFKNHNPKLDSDTLTELAQRTLDRLVFLRFLEDKGIEGEHRVERFGKTGRVWEDFIEASHRLDDIYNGIVYKHHDILDGANLHVDDSAFASICESLAHINSPYDFNAIPIHILGSIYERFLGKVIVATDKRVKVEEKPEVRKAGGVYYTPEYIVRYIVENTVGKLIAGKTPNQIAEMRFADIACGSGSFLLGIFDLLINYHGRYYNENPAKARKGDCIKRNGKLYLSLHKKREILLNNIYGVDIDAQAVEVCQLSLYLKLLQEETEASAHQYLLDFEHTARLKKLLPDLSKNIVCGNSLIGRDIELDLFGENESKINPMNFEDAFPEVMKRGGFDAVIGNPPWGASLSAIEKKNLSQSYSCFQGNHDSYLFFIEKAGVILRNNGNTAFITPDSWIKVPQAERLRRILLSSGSITSITTLPQKVFRGVSANCLIFTFTKGRSSEKCQVNILEPKSDLSNIAQYKFDDEYRVSTAGWRISPDAQFQIFQKVGASQIVTRVCDRCTTASEFLDVMQGIVPYSKESHSREIIEKRAFHSPTRLSGEYGIWIQGRAITRYHLSLRSVEYLRYGRWLHRPRKPKYFQGSRILIQEITGGHPPSISACYCDLVLYHDPGVISCLVRGTLHLNFLLGILNSRFLSWYHHCTSPKGTRHAFPKVLIGDIRAFPMPRIQLSQPIDKARHDDIVTKVHAMLEAKKQLAKAQTDKDKTYYENKCASLDRQIDRLVYDLYGLTEDEIKIVEEVNP